MPKANHGQSMLSGLVDSDSDDQLVEPSTMPIPDSAEENMAPAKKGRAKRIVPAPAKPPRAKAPARRASSRLETKAKPAAAPKGGRKVLMDKPNPQDGSDTEDVDIEQNEDIEMEDAEDASVVAVKETKVKATRKAPAGRGKATQGAAANANHDAEDVLEASALNSRAKKTNPAPKRQVQAPSSSEKVIMETQVPVIDVDGDEEVTQLVSRASQSAARRRSLSRARPTVQHRRAGSASDTERSDPALRRKLGEVTKKYENLNVKYQDLREIGLKEAERNFERLKKQAEEKTAGKTILRCEICYG